MTQEMQKSTIRRQTLEKIAIHFGELDSGPAIVEHLKDWGVPSSLIEYPNTKWRMIFSVLWHYANSPEDEDRKMLLKIIGEILHPLMYNGDRRKAQEACDTFNNLLDFDNFQARYSTDKKKYEVNYEPTDEEWDMIYEQDDTWVQEAKAEQKFWKNPENQSLVATLRKSYQTLINIVEVFCYDPSKPTYELNEAYLKTKSIVAGAAGELRTQAHHLYEVSGHLGNLYYPFINLFSAEAESKTNGKVLAWDNIRPRMHSAYGDIDMLFRRAEGSDVISTPDTQKILNDVALLLSQTQEKNEALTLKNTPAVPHESIVRITEMPELRIRGIEENLVMAKPKNKKIRLPHFPKDLRWEEITLHFLNEQEVILKVRDTTLQTTYEAMGFQDEKRKLPNKQWVLLRLIAIKGGELTWKGNWDLSVKEVGKFKKQKQLLSETLKAFFQIDDDPFHNYKTEKSYRIKLNLLPEDGAKRINADEVIEDNDVLGIDSYRKETAPEVFEE